MKKLLPLLLLLIVLAIPGCSGGGSSSCSFSGLVASATYLVVINNPSTGIAITFTRVSSSTGTLSISTNTNCSNVVVVQVTNSNSALSASPSSINLESPPATVTVTGQNFDTTYGMPRVEYFDATGFLVGWTNATSVWGGGTALECSVPALYQVYSGTYTIRVTNKTSQGYYSQIIGTATVTAWGRDRLDSDGDGWYDDEDCDPYDPYRYTGCYCGGGQEPITVCP
jgi:hypothetical protein